MRKPKAQEFKLPVVSLERVEQISNDLAEDIDPQATMDEALQAIVYYRNQWIESVQKYAALRDQAVVISTGHQLMTTGLGSLTKWLETH